MVPENFVRERYDAIAPAYSARERRLYWVENHGRTARDYLRAHAVDAVIDIGCGSGAVIRKLADEFPKVRFLGVDFSREMIRIARDSDGGKRIEWIEADLAGPVARIDEVIRSTPHVLLLAMGPMEYYHSKDSFCIQLGRLFETVRRGAFIGTFLNRDLLGRSLLNKEKRGKRYWSWKEAADFFGRTGDGVRLRFTSCILFDPFNSLAFLDRFFLAADRVLRRLPVCIARRIAVSFEIEVARKG